MRLLHLTDTHLHRPGATTYHPEIDSARRLETVLAATVTEGGGIDAIVLTGDICDDGSVVGAQAVRDRLTAAYPGVPVLAVPGNHDLTASITEVFGDVPERLGGWRVVGAASNEPQRIAGSGLPVVEALSVIDPADDTPLLLLMHHPLRSRSTHEWFVLRDAAVLERRLAHQQGPVVVLTGHMHQAFEAIEGHVHHVTAPSTYYPIVHEGRDWQFAPDGTGALLIDLGADRVERIAHVRA